MYCNTDCLFLSLNSLSWWFSGHSEANVSHFISPPCGIFASIGMLIPCGFSVRGFRLWSTMDRKSPAPFDPPEQNSWMVKLKITGGKLCRVQRHLGMCVASMWHVILHVSARSGSLKIWALFELQQVRTAYLCSTFLQAAEEGSSYLLRSRGEN